MKRLKEGDSVRFFVGDSCPMDYGEDVSDEFLDQMDGSAAVITGIAIKDDEEDEFSYFDLKFSNGFEMEAVSGNQLLRQ